MLIQSPFQVSERGVVFLRNQEVKTQHLLELGQRLSNLTGSVSISGPDDSTCMLLKVC